MKYSTTDIQDTAADIYIQITGVLLPIEAVRCDSPPITLLMYGYDDFPVPHARFVTTLPIVVSTDTACCA